MWSIKRLSLWGITVGVGILAGGCSTNSPPQSQLVASTQGVTCTKCQVTWVKVYQANGKRITGYTWGKRDICPDCMDAVTSFLNTGKFEHTCKTCGDTMEVCEAHPQR